MPSKWEYFSDSAPPSLCKFTWGIWWLSLVIAPDCASTFICICPFHHSLMDAEFLCFHRLPCSRCLCRHAELLNSLLVALKICCFMQVEFCSALPACMLILACAEEDRELPGLLLSLLLHGCIPASPPPGPAREESHRSHLCSCAVRKHFRVLRKKRQLKTLELFVHWTYWFVTQIELFLRWERGCLATASFLA